MAKLGHIVSAIGIHEKLNIGQTPSQLWSYLPRCLVMGEGVRQGNVGGASLVQLYTEGGYLGQYTLLVEPYNRT